MPRFGEDSGGGDGGERKGGENKIGQEERRGKEESRRGRVCIR